MKIIIDPLKTTGHISRNLHGHFIEFLGSCIYNGIWVGKDSAIPNYDGIRKAFVDAMRELKPSVIRWPGGCYADTYHWRNGIGPVETRPVTYNENFGTYEPDTNQFGTHEFMNLCRLVGAKPWINVNMMTGSPAEMREWMEYCNREDITDLVKERAENGDPEPFNVEYWGIGNEVWAGGGTMTAESYVNEYRKYASAFPNFQKVSGESAVSMKRIASGPDGNKPLERVRWTKDVFQALAQYRMPPVDAYDLHFYNWNLKKPELTEMQFDEEDWNEVILGCQELEDVILEQDALIREGLAKIPQAEGQFASPEPHVDLIVGEWGNWHGAAFRNRPALYQQCTMRDALTTALTLDIFHRNCSIVKMACVAQTVNVLNSLFLTDGEAFIKTPNYDVFRMYQVHEEAEALEIEKPEDTEVAVFASVKDGTIAVNLLNLSMNKTKTVTLELSNEAVYAGGILLHNEDPHACNTKEQPDLVRAVTAVEPQCHTSGEYTVELAPASIQVLRFQTK